MAENAPGVRMLSSALKLRRRLLAETLLFNERLFRLAPSRLRPIVPGVLVVLEALPGVP